ncbi:MAG: hypothetical protein HAW67_02490 [Endozoicomonadaceae bacterium]|nr:hypothetical protein [Endozoicomonadaceae bacterium]
MNNIQDYPNLNKVGVGVVNTDNSAYEAYIAKKRRTLEDKRRIENLEAEVLELKKSVTHILSQMKS